MRIIVGEGSCGIATGAKKTAAEFEKQITAQSLPATVGITGCVGNCYLEPIVDIYDDDGKMTRYTKVQPENVEAIVEGHVKGGKPVGEMVITPEDERVITG